MPIRLHTFTGLIFNQEQNTLSIKYNKERADRKLDNTLEKERLVYEIKDLEHELRICKDKSE